VIMLFAFSPVNAQSDYTVSKTNIGSEQVLVRIEHTNGKYAEYILKGNEDEVDVNLMINSVQDNTPTGLQNDLLQTTIELPSEDYSSSPIEFFDAGTKIYCFGTNEIYNIDPANGTITNTIPLFDAGNFNVKSFLSKIFKITSSKT